MNQSTNPYHQTLPDSQWWLLEFPLWEEFLKGLHQKMASKKQIHKCLKRSNVQKTVMTIFIPIEGI
jgi:hypothetical protein